MLFGEKSNNMLFSLKESLRVAVSITILFFLVYLKGNKVSGFLMHITLNQFLLSHIASPSKTNVIKKPKGLLGRFLLCPHKLLSCPTARPPVLISFLVLI